MRGCTINGLILEPPRCGYECYAMLPRGAVVVGAMVGLRVIIKVMARARVRVEVLQTRLLHSKGVKRACVYV